MVNIKTINIVLNNIKYDVVEILNEYKYCVNQSNNGPFLLSLSLVI